MARTKKVSEKDQLIQELTQKLARQEAGHASLVSHLARESAITTRGRTVAPGQLFVGIRNVSNYTVSIESKVTNEPTLDLHAPVPGVHDPNTVGIVSYAWWQHIRRGREYGRGMIVRDDSVLGTNYDAAPADLPSECHPDHAKHLVIDAEEWVRSRDDAQITEDVFKMTAEAPLRKLEALHFKERERLLNQHVELAWPERKRRVDREMPSKYKHLKAVVVDRLKELEPKTE